MAYIPKLTHKQRVARRKAVLQDATEDASIKELIIKHGLSKSSIVHICNAAGIRLPVEQVKRRSLQSFVILRKLLDGGSQSDIAKSLGVSRQAIHSIRIEAESAGFNFPDKQPSDNPG